MSQLSLFDTIPMLIGPVECRDELNEGNDLAKIEGLKYIPNFITPNEASILWKSINDEKWLDDLKRRVQHYGYKYDYKSRFIDYTMKLGSLPEWSLMSARRLYKLGLMQELPDQLIVNEYKPGQGIANHVDCEPCFGNTIASLSLGSSCVMDLVHRFTKEKVSIFLEPCSLVLLQGAARYGWTHGIQGRKTDIFKDKRYERDVRISLTFRNVQLKACPY